MEGRSMDVDWQADLDLWLAPFCCGATAQDAGADAPSLHHRADWSRRSQERPADGAARW
jgi:hypothetical protein